MGSCTSRSNRRVLPFEDNGIPQSTFQEQNYLELNEACWKTFQKLAPKEEDTLCRTEVCQILTDWKRTGKLAEIESCVSNISTKELSTLAAALTGSDTESTQYLLNLEGDLRIKMAKAYAIYCWVARYGVAHQLSDPNSKLVLERKEAICHGYTNLFFALAEIAGLEVGRISGHTRMWDVQCGCPFQPDNSNSHTWNVVKLSGTWFPIDCTFGSGNIVNKKEFQHHFSHLYFAPLPEQLILTHWPGGSDSFTWQLLQQPIKLHELKPLIVPSLEVLAQGMQPEMVTQVIPVPENSHLPIVTIPLKSSQNLKFRATINPLDSPSNLQNQIDDANQLTYVERDEENVKVHAIIPGRGKFSLDISVAEQMESTYTTSLSYYVHSHFIPQEPQYCSYPRIYQTKSNFHLLSCNAQGMHKVAHTCKCDGSELKLTFTADPNAKIQHYIKPGRSGQSELFWCYTKINKDKSDPSLHTLHAVFPFPGWWTVKLVDGNVIMSYQVYAEHGKKNVLFPNVHVYPNEDNIELVSSEIIEYQDNGNPFVLQFYAHPESSFSHGIDHLTDDLKKIGTLENCSIVSRSPTAPNLFTVQAIFPHAGNWRVNLYSRKEGMKNHPKCLSLCVRTDFTPQEPQYCAYPRIYRTKINFHLLSCNAQGSVANTCKCEGGELKLSFTADPNAKIQHYIKPGRSGQSESFWCYTKINKDEGNPSLQTLHAVFPSPGWWRVKLEDDNVIMSYQVYAEHGKTNVLFSNVYVYPNDANIELVSSEITEFQDNGNPFVLQFYALPGSSFSHDIDCLTDDLNKIETLENCSIVSRSPTTQNLFTLQAIFPQAGKWRVNLYSRKEGMKEYPQCLSFHVYSHFTPQEPQYCSYPQIHKTKSNFHLLSCNAQGKVAHTCKCKRGELKMTFTADPNANIQHYIKPGRSGQSDSFWCYTKINKDKSYPSLQTFHAVFPSPGWWRVKLDDGNVIMNYQVYAERGKTNILFPNVHVYPNEANIKLVSNEVTDFQDNGNPFVLQFYALRDSSFSHDIDRLTVDLKKIETFKNCSIVLRCSKPPSLFTLQAIFPHAGNWRVNLYSRKEGMKNHPKCLSFCVHSDFTQQEPQYCGYPQIHQTKSNFHLLSCNAHRKVAHTCKCEGGELKLTFTADPNAKIQHYIKPGKRGQSDSFWCYTKIIKDKSDHSLQTLHAVFPSPGWWRVKLDDGSVVMSYQVYAECGKTNILFPNVHVYPNEEKIELVSSEITEFQDNGNPFVLQFYALPGSSFSHDIDLLSDDLKKIETFKNCSIVLRCSKPPSLFTLQAIFPHAGNWRVNLYSRKEGTKNCPKCLSFCVHSDFTQQEPQYCSYPQIHKTISNFHLLSCNAQSKVAHTCKCKRGELKLTFKADSNAKIQHYIKPGRSGQSESFWCYTKINKDENDPTLQTLHAVFPSPGWWRVKLEDDDVIMSYQVYAECSKNVPFRNIDVYPNEANSEINKFQDSGKLQPTLQEQNYLELNEVCWKTFQKLAPKEEDTPCRAEVCQILTDWKRTGKLAEIESCVSNIYTKELSTLAAALTGSYTESTQYLLGLEGDLCIKMAKAYAIYCWLAKNIRYDVASKVEHQLPDPDPKLVLEKKEAVCHGYANLFLALAEIADLEVGRISGHTRMWDVQCGCPFKPDNSNSHTWNVIKLGGTWFPIDCTFGSGSIVNDERFQHDFSHIYFAAPPEQLILTHWPGGNDKWQLLQQPIELDELKSLIVPSLKVLAQGICPQIVTQVIPVPENSHLPIVTIPLKSSQNLKFRATINPLDSPSNLQNQRDDANQLTYIECDEENVKVHAIIPGRGKFSLDISVAEQMESTYTTSLSYYVQSHFTEQEPQYCGYPRIYQTKSNFHLLSCNSPGKVAHTCKCKRGELKLTFTADPNANIRHYIKPGRSGQSESFQCYTKIKREKSDPSFRMLHAIFPSPGWWRVNLEDDNYVIMSYQVYAECGKKDVLFPNVHVYPNEANIELVSSEIIDFQDNGNPFVLQFYALPGSSFLHEIDRLSDDLKKIETLENCSIVLRSPTTPKLFTLQAIFPRAGKWRVNLYSRKEGMKEYPQCLTFCVHTHFTPQEPQYCGYPRIYQTKSNFHLLSCNAQGKVAHTCKCNRGELKLTFKADSNAKIQHYIKPGRSGQSKSLRCYTKINKAKSDPSLQTLHVIFPSPGWWRVKLEDDDVIMSYQVYAECGKTNVLFPNVFPNEANIELVPNGMINFQDNGDPFVLQYHALPGFQFSHKICLLSPNDQENETVKNCTNVSRSSAPPNLFTLQATFPRAGKWAVNLYAGRPDMERFPLVIQVKYVNITNPQPDLQFPTVYSKFDEMGFRFTDVRKLRIPTKVVTIPTVIRTPLCAPDEIETLPEATINGKTICTAIKVQSTSAREQELQATIDSRGMWTVKLCARCIQAYYDEYPVMKYTVEALCESSY